MKYQWKRYWAWICLAMLVIVFVLILRMTEIINTEVFFGALAAMLTLSISVISHYRESDRFFKELFTEFNRRYDRMNNFLNQIKTDTLLTDNERQRIIDYFNLCSEEYMWVRKGRIPIDIWESWHNGIKTHLKNPYIRKLYEEEKAQWKSSYYGFFDEAM